jgi:hypothetical protein
MSEFTFLPDFVFEETLEYKTLISEFENGAEQRRRKWAAPLHKWHLRFSNRVKGDMQAVREFFKSKYGRSWRLRGQTPTIQSSIRCVLLRTVLSSP